MMNHAKINGMIATDDISTSSDNELQVTGQDANVILHQRQFHFMYVTWHVCYLVMND